MDAAESSLSATIDNNVERSKKQRKNGKKKTASTWNCLFLIMVHLLMMVTFIGYLSISIVPHNPNNHLNTLQSPPQPNHEQHKPLQKEETNDNNQQQQEKPNQEANGQPNNDDDDDDTKYHIVFSTGCRANSDWQSYMFFFHVLQSGQPGNVTRIASGCNPRDGETLRRVFDEQIKIMAPDRFHLHLTPEFSTVKPGLRFKYFNKPFGFRHWFQHVLGYDTNAILDSIKQKNNNNAFPPNEHDDTIVILFDPDQIIIRPLTKYIGRQTEVWRRSGLGKNVPPFEMVKHGQPFGQQYGFGTQWKTKVNATYVCNCTDTRVDSMSRGEVANHYPLGPPYMATARDMVRIATLWTDVVLRIHDNYPHLLAEMFGYCFAAAHLNLPHRVAHSFMVSDPGAPGEGWRLVDKLQDDTEVCNSDRTNTALVSKMPHVLHYCHRYMVGKWFIGKYRLRKDFLNCNVPLLLEPKAKDIVGKDYQITPDGERLGFKSPKSAKRNTFMICQLIPRLNQAALFYKQHHCQDDEDTNYNYTYIFHESIEE